MVLETEKKNIKNNYGKKKIYETYRGKNRMRENKTRYTATPVACGWAGAIFETIWAGAVRSKNNKSEM